MKGRKQCLRIKLFISRPKGRVESSSETVKMYSGRPQVSSLIEDEVKNWRLEMLVEDLWCNWDKMTS